MVERHRVGLIGARGHTGAELLRLFWNHPRLEVAYLGSRALDGKPLADLLPEAAGSPLRFENLGPDDLAHRSADAVVLALPNGLSQPYVDALAPDVCVVDLSADHRFDDAWTYGLPEHQRDALRGARRIANPGCYATAAQVALEPIASDLVGPPAIFGVSGYSGAGTTPSPRNDVEALRDNLMPYALTDHVHEREIGDRLGLPVRFMPHVAPFFRGITLTIDCTLREPRSAADLTALLRDRYAGEPFISIQDEAPLVRDAAGSYRVTVGGITTSGPRAVLVATIDNLLKGAASQALQNLNLALHLPEPLGLPTG